MPDFPFLIVVTPNVADDNPADDTLTVRRDKHDGDWLGRLPRGFVCKAVEEYEFCGKKFYRIAKHVTPWPFPVNGDIEIWANAAYLPPYTGETKPVTTDATWQGVLRAVAKAVLEALGE